MRPGYSPEDAAYLSANPHAWRDFERNFGTLPEGFAVPEPEESDYDYLKQNPQAKDDFIRTFGDKAYQLAPSYVPKQAEEAPLSAAPAEPEERKTGYGAIWKTFSDAYEQDGLIGVKNVLMSPTDPQLVQDFLSAGNDDDETFWGKYNQFQNDKSLMVMRSVARLGEGLAFLPEATLQYFGYDDAAAVPGRFRDNYKQAEKDFVSAMSPEARKAIEQQFVQRAADGSYGLGEGATDPLWWMAAGIDTAIMMAPGVGLGGKAGRLAYGVAHSKALANAAARKAPTAVAMRAAEKAGKRAALIATTVAYNAGEALPAAGMAGSAIEQTLVSLDEESLSSYEPYLELRNQGLSHEAARAQIANDRAVKGALGVAIATGLTGAPVASLIAKFAATGVVAKTMAGAVAKGVVAEGAQEFAQEGSQQYIQNWAERPITHIDQWEGVLESAITGAVLGGLIGGGVAGVAQASGPVDAEKDPSRSPVLRKGLREYNAARDNLYNAIGSAKDPNTKISFKDVEVAREEYRTASLTLNEALLSSGVLKPEQQAEVAKAIEEAKASGIKGLQQDVNDVKGAVRPADEAGAPKGDAGSAAAQAEAAQEGAAPQLNSVETARLETLTKVASADTVTAEEIQSLAKDGLAKVLPSGVPMLLPAGKRQREELAKRMAAQEAAAAPEKAQEKPAAAKAQPAKEPAKAEPAKPAAKAAPVAAAQLAPGYTEADIAKPGEKAKKPLYEPSDGETRALSESDYAALERHEAGKSVTTEEMTNLVKVGLVASREGGKVFVTRPLGKRELKAYREAGRQTALERDMQQDIGITGDTLRLSAEGRRTGRKARAEAAAAQAQVDQIFERTKKAAGPKVSAELDKMAAERETELAAEKDKDWDRAKDEVELDEYETLTTLFDEETRVSLRGSIRGILKQVDAKAKRREAAAQGRLKVAFSSTRAFDITGALVEGSKVWKDIVEIGAMKLLQGIVRIPDWNAAMEKALKKQWAQVSPHLDKILSQSREVARNPLKLLEIKHKKANSKTERLRGQPAGRGLVMLRAQMEALRAEGEPHRFWYEQSSKVIMEVVNNDVPQARKLAGLLSIYSSGTRLDSNTGNALKAWYQWLDGKKIETGSEIQIKAGRFRSQDRDAETWLARGEFPVGTKRSNFYVNLMREIDPAEFEGFQGATVDLWMMRAFGYHAEAPNDAQYAFVATEIQRMARDLGWEPQQAQAAIWVAAKARYENTEAAAKQEAARRKYVKFVPGPLGKDRMEILDLRRYNRLRRDYALKALFSPTGRMDFGTELEKRMSQINWESKPSVTAGVLPGIHSEQKIERIAEYHAAISRALQDETGADALARRLGMLSFGQIEGPSAWYYNRDDYFRFTHYSKRLTGEFVTLDIGKFGTGVAMTPAEQSRGPRIALYPENAELTESAVTRGATEYTVEVLKDEMYDFTADPMGLRKGKSFDAAEDAIRLAGFRGYYVKDHTDAMLRGQARLFNSHPAVRSDVSQTFRGYVGSGSALRIALPRLHGNSGKQNAPKVEAAAAQKMSAYSAILGAIIKQDAVSWAMPYYTPTQEFSNGVDIDLGRPLTSAEAEALYRSTVGQMAARGITDDSVLHMFAPIQHGSGAYFLNFTAPPEQEVKDAKTKKAKKALAEKYASGIPNIEFHGIIRRAIDTVFTTEADLFKESVETITFSRFASDGDMVSNDWKVDSNGEGYRRRAEEAGERAAFEWAVTVLAPKVEAINKDFGERYGWSRRERKDEGFGLTTPLAGLPANAKGPGGVLTPMGPSSKVRLIAQAYMRAAGFTYTPPQDYVRVDPELAARVAAAYGALKHSPKDPEVKASYDAFAKETLAQWEWVKKAGLKVEVIQPGSPDPYEGNPRNAIRDIVDNNHFWLFPTAAGLGNEIHGDTPKDHPILAKTGEKIGDHELLVNDIFRITHDYFGHAKEGVGFRADGEYNAWRQHSSMYSPLARRAMSAETLGQNSWMNYGPFGETNRTASVETSIFAEQKAALLPEEFTSDEAVRFSPAESAGPGMTVEQVRSAIDPIQKATGVPVRVVKTFADLPKYVQDWARARGIEPAGVFAQRKQQMFIVADKMNSSFEAIETYAHEVVGHFGLRGVLGERFKATMHQLAKSFPTQLKVAADAHKVSLTDKKLSPAQLENNLLLAAEEMVAHSAGLEFRGTSKLRPRGPYRRIVDYVRSQLLSVGWLKQWNDNDLIALIARSHDYAKSGRARRQWALRDYEARMGKKMGSTPTEFSGDSSVKAQARPGSGFESWFKGSKAVKDDGSPQVFFHGTDRAFWTFKIGGRRRGADGNTSQKSGLFFAEQPDFAKDYAGENGRVIPVFLSVQKPLDLTNGFKGLPAAERAALAEAMELEGLSLPYYDAVEPGQEWSVFNVEYAFGEELIGVLKSIGYDGAKLSEERGGSWVVFSPNQAKSVFNSGEFSLFNDDILASVGEAPIYYSAVGRAVEALRMNKATGQQWLNSIKNSPGVKSEEVEWLFLEDFLQANNTYTKDQVLAYIDENKIEVSEVLKGGSQVGVSALLPGDTKFADQQLPGGENYRELLLTLPQKVAPSTRYVVTQQGPSVPLIDTTTGQEVYRASYGKIVEKAALMNAAEAGSKAPFVSGHYDEPNVLAHVRFNDRTDADGKRVLFVEEIQSDWHQRGRREGYRQQAKPAADITGWAATMMPWTEGSRRTWRIDDASGEYVRMVWDVKTAEEALAVAQRLPNLREVEGKVPDAPFKKTWHELALKRILRLAVDGGYDRIAWTTGETQADRYDLSQHLDEIYIERTANDYWSFSGYRDGAEVALKGTDSLTELEQWIGKDLAEKAAKLPPGGDQTFSGIDLKLGGKGMRGFYDKILVDAANKLGKKFGAKVGATRINAGDSIRPYEYRYEHPMEPYGKQGVDMTPVHSLDITPQMQSAVPGGMPMFAPVTGNPILDGFFSKIGKPHIPFRQRMENFTTGLGDRTRQNVFDHFHGIARTGDIEGYMSARLSTGSAGLMRAIMEWGHPVWDQGLHGVAGDKGFNDILRTLGKDVDLWAGWMVARRAQRLKGENRENLFTDVEINEMIALGNARPDFAVAAAEYAEFKKKVLDFAEEAGIIDPNTRPLWENDDHVPFYRIMEDGLLKGASAGRGIGFVKKQIIQLKGGSQNIGDPIENILRNWTALIEASLQAKASRTVIDNLTGTGLVVKIDQPAQAYQLTSQALQQLLTQAQINPGSMSPASQMGLLALSQPAAHKDGQVTVWRNGQRERWQVHDPMLFKSMQAINPEAWSTWMNLLRLPKRVLTKTITIVPLFITRNFWRDIWSAFTIGATNRQKVPFVPVLDNLKGVYSMLTTSDTAKTLISSGAGFIGTGFNPQDAAAEAVSLAKDVRLGHRFWHSPALLYHAYMRLSEAAENASRVAIYEAAIKAGRSKMEAAFEAKDIMDFSLRGSSPVVRFMVETVPFWGARTQGLYKLGRAVAGDPVGVGIRGALMTLATIALLVRNMDDERYKELTLDQKNLYWHAFDLFEKGDHWKIPKPFEVGTIFGTVPEAIIDAAIAGSEDPDAAKQSLKVVSHAFLQALDLKPEVAAVWPMVELALNKNTFTGAPILSMGDEGVLPQEQDAPFVRSTYRLLAQAMPEVAPEALRSPKQLQHLARGYMGSLQDWVLVGTDIVSRRIMGEPKPPARAATEPLFVGGFRSTGPARQTRSLNALYDIANEASKIQRSIDKLGKMEPTESTDRRLNQLVDENEFKLGVGQSFGDAVKQVSELRKAQRSIQLDTVMTPEEKRVEIESIQKDINDLARAMWELRPGGPLDPATASRLTGAGKNTQAAILRRSGMPATAALVDAMPGAPSRAMSGVFKDLEMQS